MVHKNKLAMPPTDALLITGSMGSGKTTVLSEASDLLTVRNIPHASIDLDALGTAHLPSSENASSLRMALAFFTFVCRTVCMLLVTQFRTSCIKQKRLENLSL
jgi:ABC-type uncharacterized transport system fused permease/ATPase subunit